MRGHHNSIGNEGRGAAHRRVVPGLWLVAVLTCGCASAAAAQGPKSLPSGEAIAQLAPERCPRLLRRAGVSFERYRGDGAGAVEEPIMLEGPVRGIRVVHARGSKLHSVLDCRLVLALWRWVPVLRELGVERVEHYSALRPGAEVRGTEEPSGHALGLAIDVGRLDLGDGTELDVVEHWGNRRRGVEPCPSGEDPDDWPRLRRVVCEAVDRELFQVVITPHHNRAHRNHVHLEVVPDADWSYVR